MFRLVCVHCAAAYPADQIIYTCSRCGHLLAVEYALDGLSIDRAAWDRRPLSVWRYRELLPVSGPPVTLQEGGTPLYRLDRIGAELGLPHLYAKHEGMNPSGSFKDRGMTVGVSMALELGMTSVACASTGNTSASLAQYAAKAGIPAVVLLPAGKVALGKIAQALMHGARVISVRGNFDRALEMVHEPLPLARALPPQLGQPVPARGAEDDRVRGGRPARRRARPDRPPRRERGQHLGRAQGAQRGSWRSGSSTACP